MKKLVISSTKLYRQLDVLRSVIGKNKTLPILNCIYFEWTGNDLLLVATDLETSIASKEEVISEDSGAFAILSNILLETIKHLPEQPLTLNFLEDKHLLEISSSYGKYQIATFDTSEYPKIDDIIADDSLSIDGIDLLNGINATLHCIANDELAATARGMYFHHEDNQLAMVGAQSSKLVEFLKTGVRSNNGRTVKCIIPTKPLTILKNYLNNYENQVSIEYNSNNVKFSLANISITARLIEGQYPNYKAAIPNESPNILKVNRDDFLGSVKRIANFSETQSHGVVLECRGQSLVISAENIDFSNKAKEQLSCNYQGDDLTIAFSSKHLISLIDNLDTAELSISLSLAIKPMLIHHKPSEDANVLMLLAPIQND